jgi:hypothetical protein
MANIRKSFNFRSGLQVDNDNFVINSNGLVGIGTSVPSVYLLNVYGDTRITGFTTAKTLFLGENLNVSGITTVGFITASSLEVSGGVNVGTALTVPLLKVGSSEVVDNLIGYARTTFITDNGGVGLHTTSKIGINTATSPGASDEELNVFGDLKVTGLTTTGSLFVTGTTIANLFSGSGASLTDIPNNATTATSGNTANTIVSRDLNGDFSAGTITASLDGIATFAEDFNGEPNITVSSVDSTGNIKTNQNLIASSVGIGTSSPSADIHIRKSSTVASLQVTSDNDYSIITLGESVTLGSDNGQIRYGYGNALGDAEYSTEESLDIINYGEGNLNFYLDPNGITRAMVLTRSGNLGINFTSPSERLSVGGGVTVTGNLYANGDITGNSIIKTGGTSSEFLKADGSVDNTVYLTPGTALTAISADLDPTLGAELDLNGFNILDTIGSNISVFGDVSAGGTIVAGTDFSSKLVSIASGKIKGDNGGLYVGLGITDYPFLVPTGLGNTYVAISTTGSIDATGIVTATGGFTSGTGGPVEISVSGSILTFNVVGVGSTSLTLF